MEKKVVNVDYELGKMVGEYIIYVFLPTLSTDMLKSRNIIPVSLDLEREWKNKQETYRKLNYDITKDKKLREAEATTLFYENLAWYKENIEKVFLPPVLECRIPKFKYNDEDNLIKGIRKAIWDSDMSHYDTIDIEIISDDGWWCTDVKLKYAK